MMVIDMLCIGYKYITISSGISYEPLTGAGNLVDRLTR